jgi:pyrroline-5-carboxylate reductase
MKSDNRIWLIGCGNMGGAMLKGWLAQDMDPSRVTVVDPSVDALPPGVRLCRTIPAGEAPPALLLLAVKPQIFKEVAAGLADVVGEDTLLVSILAGVDIAALKQALPRPARVVRIMPNMPSSIGRGVSVLCGAGLSADDQSALTRMMTPLGAVEWIDDEELFHPVIAVSGSGPAFVFRFIQAMAEKGAALGLPEDQALRLAIATVEGAAALAAVSTDSPAVLAEQVRSPNGTTNAGLLALDEDGVFADRIAKTMQATADRSVEMTKGER